MGTWPKCEYCENVMENIVAKGIWDKKGMWQENRYDGNIFSQQKWEKNYEIMWPKSYLWEKKNFVKKNSEKFARKTKILNFSDIDHFHGLVWPWPKHRMMWYVFPSGL